MVSRLVLVATLAAVLSGCTRATAATVEQSASSPAAPAIQGAPQGSTLNGIPVEEFHRRREALAQRVGEGVILAMGSPDPDFDYISFFQNSNYLYLTGITEPNTALVIVNRAGKVTSTVFVLPNDPVREVWSGRLMGLEGATALTGMPARHFAELGQHLDSLLKGQPALHIIADVRPAGRAPGRDQFFIESLRERHPKLSIPDARNHVGTLRRTKSAAELELIRKSVAITVDAHRQVLSLVEPGMNEFEAQALIEYTFRRNGAGRPAFATIVGSGPNSTTLHYNRNDRFMQAGDMVVMDIGSSYMGYAADLTRTVPVNGIFSPAQRDIYQLVRDAQAAAERAAVPGAQRAAMSQAANTVLREGLARLGLIESPDATYDCGQAQATCSQLSLYYMHGLGHGIGLDVHDPDLPTISPGSAFTIEPGVYVRGNLLEILPDSPRNRAMIERIRPAHARYRDIGVRIEDDYIVTESGLEWISHAPREIAEIEAAMREPYRGPAARDAAKVQWYRQR
jgi:Xaa-Pro aminopeptidase